MKENPLVSVVIPAYNATAYVREAVESALQQTYKNIEIIVVDDGSTDNLRETLASYVKQGMVRYLYQKNKGLSAARNTGIREARGEYIALLDADDMFLPNKIEKQVAFLTAHPECDVCYCDLWHFYEGEEGKMLKLNYTYYSGSEVFPHLLKKNFINPLTTVFRKSIFERFGYFDESIRHYAEDWDLWLRFSYGGACFCFLPDILAKYRMRKKGSLSYDLVHEIGRRKTALFIFKRLKQKMSYNEIRKLKINYLIFNHYLKLAYAHLGKRCALLRKIHSWLQQKRLASV